SKAAVRHLEIAMSKVEEPDAETRRLARVALKTPERELDRSITAIRVADHERPMWEAFEQVH
ncbi:MAG: hypothetical protein V3U11_05175, partial [Planctomycetota bacterium]